MNRDFTLSPPPTNPRECQDALIRLAFYGGPAFERGAKLYVDDARIISEALNLPLPPRFSHQVSTGITLLEQSIMSKPASEGVQKIKWCMGPLGYTNADKQAQKKHHFFVDDFADPHASSEWIRLAGVCAQPQDDTNAWPTDWPEQSSLVSLIGPGPSLQSAPIESDHLQLCIASALPLLPENMRIDGIVFTDSLAILAPSTTARQNLESLKDAARQGTKLITHTQLAKAVRPHLPQELHNSLYAIPLTNSSARLSPSDTGNVLTTLALPVAARASQAIHMYGFDGSLNSTSTPSNWEHHQGLRNRTITKMRLTHPLSALASDYENTHKQRTAGMLDHLTRNGITISYPDSSKTLCTWTNENRDLAPAPGGQGRRLLASTYSISATIDRHPKIGAALTTLCIGFFVAFLRYLVPPAMANILTIALIGLLAGTCVLCWLNLRSRQTRMIDDARRKLTMQFTEMNEALNARIDELENQNTSTAPYGDQE